MSLFLQIFIKDNQGDSETTAIQYLGIFGGLLDSTNMDEFKRVGLYTCNILCNCSIKLLYYN